MQNSSESPARLLSEMEKCSEIVYSLLDVEPRSYEQAPVRSHHLNDVRHTTADKSQEKQSRHHRKKVAVTQTPHNAKRQSTATSKGASSRAVSNPDIRRSTPDHLSSTSSAKTLKHNSVRALPKDPPRPLLSSTSASVLSNLSNPPTPTPAYSISTSSHLLSLATQRLMQTLSVRLDPSRSDHALPSDVQAILPQLMAVIQLLDATNPSPLPHPPALSLGTPSDLSSRPPALSASDLRQLSSASLPPVRHETGTNTDSSHGDIRAMEREQLRDELARAKSDKFQLSEKCQRLESCLRGLRTNRDELSHQLTESTQQRSSLSSTLQQLRAELRLFEERSKSLAGEVDRGNQLYLSSVHSLSSSIQLLDPTFPDQSELDGISLGADFQSLRSQEVELSRARAKCAEYRNKLIRTHTDLLRCVKQTGPPVPSYLSEVFSELDNFMRSEHLVDASTDVNKLSSGYSSMTTPGYDRHVLSTDGTPVLSSTLNNEAEFDERLSELDAQIGRLQLHIHQSRDQLQ